MYKKTIPYEDFNGVERTEDFYFNLMESEVAELQMSNKAGLDQVIQELIRTQDMPAIIELFKKVILMSYGEKSVDGKRFIKSKELTEAFCQTNAYSNLFMELATNEKAAIEFINGITPKEMKKEAEVTTPAKKTSK